ncbi:MAG: DUF2239 family protein [Rhizobiaceae bacterium]|nr:DUF2239 family protein [Rhizobiaceae bacterium]
MTGPHCTAFAGARKIASGSRAEVALALKARESAGATEMALIFDDATGRQIDFDLSGSADDILARLDPGTSGGGDAPRGRGRPKLGVVSREVTLLPRHWDWLARQRGGASATLRRLIDAARRETADETGEAQARDRAYRFMSAIGGDLPQFEEASRALFAGDRGRFATLIAGWPKDIRDHALLLASAPAGDQA